MPDHGGYPFVRLDSLAAAELNALAELSAGLVPPANSLGQGAKRGKLWLDLSTTPWTLRACVGNPASPSYVSSDWATLGTLDPTGGWTPLAIGASHETNAPGEGATVTAPSAAGDSALILKPAAHRTAVDVVLPPSPANGAMFQLSSTQAITTLTPSTSDGSTVLGGALMVAPNGGLAWRYDLTDNTWYRSY